MKKSFFARKAQQLMQASLRACEQKKKEDDITTTKKISAFK